jgi:hypothetical protein
MTNNGEELESFLFSLSSESILFKKNTGKGKRKRKGYHTSMKN